MDGAYQRDVMLSFVINCLVLGGNSYDEGLVWKVEYDTSLGVGLK